MRGKFSPKVQKLLTFLLILGPVILGVYVLFCVKIDTDNATLVCYNSNISCRITNSFLNLKNKELITPSDFKELEIKPHKYVYCLGNIHYFKGCHIAETYDLY